MSDTRFMPKAALRSTGIRNTTTEVPRVITGAASNMSASAGAPTDGQKAVRKARQLPDTVSPGRGGSRAAAPNRAQDARVTMIQGASRIRSGGMTSAGVVSAGPTSPFNQDQLLLLGHLLDGYKAVCVTNEDAKNGQLTQRTLDVVAALLRAAAQPQATAASPVAAPSGADVPLGQPFKTATGSTVVLSPAPAPR